MWYSIVVTGLLKYLDLSWADDLAEPPEATHVGGLRNNGTEAERATTQVCDHYSLRGQVMNPPESLAPIVAKIRGRSAFQWSNPVFKELDLYRYLKKLFETMYCKKTFKTLQKSTPAFCIQF